MKFSLAIEIKKQGPTADFERLLDYSKSLVNQHPEYNLEKCLQVIKRYIKCLGLSQKRYRVDIVNNRISFKYGNSASLNAVIYMRDDEVNEYLSTKTTLS